MADIAPDAIQVSFRDTLSAQLSAHPIDELSDRILELLCDAKLRSRPGRLLAYHAIAGGFVLGEVIERATGRSLREVLREEVSGPMGLDLDYGIPASRQRKSTFRARCLVQQNFVGASRVKAVLPSVMTIQPSVQVAPATQFEPLLLLQILTR